jgi:hypothetical protein
MLWGGEKEKSKMFRRVLTLAVLGAALFSVLVTQARAEFPDVPRDHWAYDAVTYLEGEGFIIGYPDGTFLGDRTLTRYEFAMVVSRLYDQFLDMIDEGEEPEIDAEAILDMLMEEFQPEIDELRELIAGNTARIEGLEGTVTDLDSRVTEIGGKVDEMDRRFHPFGDLTLRFYGIYPEDGMQTQRPRMMLRWGFTSKLNDELTLATRVTSGAEGDRQSAFETFDDEFGFDPLNIDSAYLQWQPAAYPGFTMWGGKFTPPWRTVPSVIDSDVTVEGLAQRYVSGDFNFHLAELVPDQKGFYLLAQAGYNNLFTDNLNVALTYHYINDDAFQFIRSKMESGALPSYWDFSRLESPDDYRAFETYVEWSHQAGEVPIKLQGDYYMNLESTAPGLEEGSGWQRAAWARMTVLDAPREPGDWNIYGEWGRLQANSVFTWLTDANRGNGDTEFWLIGWNYRLLKNTDLSAVYCDRQRLSIDEDSTAVVVEVTAKIN